MASVHDDSDQEGAPVIETQQTSRMRCRQQRKEQRQANKALANFSFDDSTTTSTEAPPPVDFGNNRLLTGFWFSPPLVEQYTSTNDLIGTPQAIQEKLKRLEKAMTGHKHKQRALQKAFHYRNLIKDQLLKDAQADNKALQAKYQNLQAEFERSKIQPGELQVKHRIREQNVYGVTKSRHLELIAEFEELKNNHEQLKDAYKTKLDQHVADQRENVHNEQHIKDLELRHNKTNERLDTANERLSAMKQRKIRQMQIDMQTKLKMEEKQNELVSQFEESEQQNQVLEEEIELLKEEIELLKEEIKLLNETVDNLIESKVKKWLEKSAEEIRP
jgi:hypothetical protein